MIFLLDIVSVMLALTEFKAIRHVCIKLRINRTAIDLTRFIDATLFMKFRREPHGTETPLSPFFQAGSRVQRSSKNRSQYSRVSSTLPNIPVYTSPTRRDGLLLSKSAVGAIATCITSHEADIFHRKDIAILQMYAEVCCQ